MANLYIFLAQLYAGQADKPAAFQYIQGGLANFK